MHRHPQAAPAAPPATQAAPVTVRPVANKAEFRTFLRLPWAIYQGDPNWVPPVLMDIKKRFDTKKNPFYEHGSIQNFLAWRNGQPVGRISAIVNTLHNQVHQDKLGFFGFYESINDQAVADALYQAAADWLKQQGMNAMRGPACPSQNDGEYAFYAGPFEGPHHGPPRFLMPYNPAYYLDLAQGAGLAPIQDLVAYLVLSEPVTSNPKIQRVIQAAKTRSEATVRELDMKNLAQELQYIKKIYDTAWEPHFGAIPMTEAEFDFLAKDLKMIAEPRLLLFVERKGEPVGFSLTFPDYNLVFRHFNGRLTPFNILKLLREKRRMGKPKKLVDWVRIQSMGILPEYQGRGLDAILYYETAKRCAELNFKFGEASWILDNNEPMNRGARLMDGELYRRYRLFEQPIA